MSPWLSVWTIHWDAYKRCWHPVGANPTPPNGERVKVVPLRDAASRLAAVEQELTDRVRQVLVIDTRAAKAEALAAKYEQERDEARGFWRENGVEATKAWERVAELEQAIEEHREDKYPNTPRIISGQNDKDLYAHLPDKEKR